MNELYHYGIKRRSGRYPYGSGARPYQSEKKSKLEGLQKYKSPTSKIIKNYAKMGLNHFLAYLIPGYGLLYNANQINTYRKSVLDRKNYFKKEGEPEKLSELKKKKTEDSVYDDLKVVNKRIGKQKGKINNCVNCSISMEMRRRGYDVVARSSASGVAVTRFNDLFENPKIVHQKSTSSQSDFKNRKNYMDSRYDEFCQDIASDGDGARGAFVFNYDKMLGSATGHCIFYEVNGKTVNFYDGQSGKSGGNVDSLISISDPNSWSYIRLDNLNLKNDITETVVSRKDKR